MTKGFQDWMPGEPPKNGEMYLLLVEIVNRDNWYPTEDDTIFRTIGFNNLENTEEDRWQCAGWDWCHDEFCETSGKIIGWMELPNKKLS